MRALVRFLKKLNCPPGSRPDFPVGSAGLTLLPGEHVFSNELNAAIESAQIILRESDDDGPRVAVICHALHGAFIYCREEAAGRIRRSFPELSDEGVKRGVRYLESRVRVAWKPLAAEKRKNNWVHGWNNWDN